MRAPVAASEPRRHGGQTQSSGGRKRLRRQNTGPDFISHGIVPSQPSQPLPQQLLLRPSQFPLLPASEKGKGKAPAISRVVGPAAHPLVLSATPTAATSTPAVSAAPAPSAPTPSAPVPSAPAKPLKKSYPQVSIDLGFAGEDLQAAVQAISRLSRPPPQIGKDGSKLSKVYVQGIGRMPISQVRLHLKSLRFRVSRILNISFLGANTAEFLLTADYVGGFKRRIGVIGQATRWRLLDTFDAAALADPKADPATKQRVQDAFIKRVHHIILKTTHPAVKASYETWLRDLNLPLPSSPAPAGLSGPPGPPAPSLPAGGQPASSSAQASVPTPAQ